MTELAGVADFPDAHAAAQEALSAASDAKGSVTRMRTDAADATNTVKSLVRHPLSQNPVQTSC